MRRLKADPLNDGDLEILLAAAARAPSGALIRRGVLGAPARARLFPDPRLSPKTTAPVRRRFTQCESRQLRALGIGSTITSIGGIHEDDVQRLLGIPDGMDVSCCIPIGWPEGRFGPAQRKSLTQIAFLDHFGAPGPWTNAC